MNKLPILIILLLLALPAKAEQPFLYEHEGSLTYGDNLGFFTLNSALKYRTPLETIAELLPRPALTPDVTDISEFETAEYNNQPALGMINAAWAYARLKAAGKGTPGQGVEIGMIDTPLSLANAEFGGRINADSWAGFIVDFTLELSFAAEFGLDEAAFKAAFVKWDLRTGSDTAGSIFANLILRSYKEDLLGNTDTLFGEGGCSVTITFEGKSATQRRACIIQMADDIYIEIPFLEDVSHANLVASIMMAAKNPASPTAGNMHGLAYNANLINYGLGYDVFVGGRLNLKSEVLFEHLDQRMSDAISFHTNKNIFAVNWSGGLGPAAISTYLDTESIRLIKERMKKTIAAFTQSTKAKADKTIFVFAAGNASKAHPAVLGALPIFIEELQGIIINVISIDGRDMVPDNQGGMIANPDKGKASSFTQFCGVMKDWCLAAPGHEINGISESTAGTAFSDIDSGTSFAAPFVTAALALLKQWWPQLGNDELVLRLLKTANKTGVYANSDIYGHGLLDLKAATEPMGATSTQAGERLGGLAVPSDSSFLQLGSAMGDALHIGFTEHKIAIFDELDTPFMVPILSFVQPLILDEYYHHIRLRSALGHFMNGNNFNGNPKQSGLRFHSKDNQAAQYGRAFSTRQNLSESIEIGMSWRTHGGLPLSQSQSPTGFSHKNSFASPFLSLAQEGISMSMRQGAWRLIGFYGEPYWQERHANPFQQQQSRTAGLMLGLDIRKGLEWQWGMVQEQDGILGAKGGGAFATGSKNTSWFSGGKWQKKMKNGLELMASGWLGVSHINLAGDGIISEMGSLLSSYFSIGLIKNKPNKLFGLRLTQPLRIEHGKAKYRYGINRSKDKRVLFQQGTLTLSPSGRELELEAFYKRKMSKRAKIGASLSLIHNPRHSAYMEQEIRALGYIAYRF